MIIAFNEEQKHCLSMELARICEKFNFILHAWLSMIEKRLKLLIIGKPCQVILLIHNFQKGPKYWKLTAVPVGYVS